MLSSVSRLWHRDDGDDEFSVSAAPLPKRASTEFFVERVRRRHLFCSAPLCIVITLVVPLSFSSPMLLRAAKEQPCVSSSPFSRCPQSPPSSLPPTDTHPLSLFVPPFFRPSLPPFLEPLLPDTHHPSFLFSVHPPSRARAPPSNKPTFIHFSPLPCPRNPPCLCVSRPPPPPPPLLYARAKDPDRAATKCVKWFDQWRQCQWDEEKMKKGYSFIDMRPPRKRKPYIAAPDHQFS